MTANFPERKPNNILIGTDPEVFLKSKITGRFVSAHGMFPGSKDEPFPLDRGAVQVDGHALEFNTDPVDNEDEFVHVVNHVFNQVVGMVNAINPNLEIILEPVARFDEDYFRELPAESKVLGCTPDYSAETGDVLSAPEIGFEPIRTSSGHIHIGWTKDEDAFDTAQFKKRFVLANRITPYLLKAAQSWETASSKERRIYYGREGAFRPKPYGVELRALDCLWLKSDETIRAVFRAAKEGFEKEYRFAL